MKSFRQLFRPSIVDDNGDAIPFIWVGNKDRIVCMNPQSSRVYAMMWHDGYGKFYPTIYVSVFEACRIHLQEPVVHLGLRSFPRCALELIRFKCASMSDAQEALGELLADLRII